MSPEIRTIEFTPKSTDADELTPEWLAGVAQGLAEVLSAGSRMTRVGITVEVPG